MHRPGHLDDTGSGNESMSRRNYLKAFTAGAALAGTVGAGLVLNSCDNSEKDHGDDHHDDNAPLWGLLTIYPPDVITIKDALSQPLKEGTEYFQIPFYNSFRIPLTPGQVLGFQLVSIGCPVSTVIAVNLVANDHEPNPNIDLRKRNERMDKLLSNIGLKPKPWKQPAPCIEEPQKQ